MKIKVDDQQIQELPDDIAVLMIADPSYGRDIPDLSSGEVNTLIHGILASIYDPDLSFAQNIKNIESRYADNTKPSAEAANTALKLIEKYKSEINECDIGLVSFDDMYQEQDANSLIFNTKTIEQ